MVSNLSRDAGVNVKSRQPTIEYRYLSSNMLMDSNGAKNVIDYIQYFMQHAASRTNKNRIVINGNNERIILTRVPRGVRMDYQVQGRGRNYEKLSYQRVPQTGLPNAELSQSAGETDLSHRPLSMPASDWKQASGTSFINRLKQLQNKYKKRPQ